MKNPREILSEMTLEEKAALLDGADFWHLKGMEKYGIPQIMVCDGPHGLRKKDYDSKGSSLVSSVPAICFPTACTTACSWDPQLLFEMGQALGNKCLSEQVSVLLGPGVNMKRSPLCGRNFEYFSEDPVLAGTLGAALIKGVQSKGVGTSLKHFCANNQETRRMTVSSEVDERALREIYLTAFELAVKNAEPWTVMNSYNRINGAHGSENAHTQQEILRDEWGFKGVVVSDWGAVNDRVLGAKNGNDLEMPFSNGAGTKKICDAVRNGELDEAVVDERALNILNLIKKGADNLQPDFKYNENADHLLARKIAGQSMVLLKNNGILPLSVDNRRVAVIGALAKTPRYQGAGSSGINPTKLDNAYDELNDMGFNLTYSQGYELTLAKKKKNPAHLAAAVECAQNADVVLLFIGLTDDYESEGFDRVDMSLPQAHIDLAEAVLDANPNVVIVLAGGSPVELPFADRASAILNSYLGGQAGAGAVADILSGKVNPSGKLAETYPLSYDYVPSKNNFPGNPATVEYRESIYIGYRYYDKIGQGVRYPFGFGLSYTTFEYSSLCMSTTAMNESDVLTISFKVKNTGAYAGSEVVQIYVADKESTIFRPEKELKSFRKVFLQPGEEKEITVSLSRRDFAFWNVNTSSWCVEGGEFDILVAASSADIRLRGTVNVSAVPCDIPDYSATAPLYYTGNIQNVPDSQFEAVLGRPLSSPEYDPSLPIVITDNLENAARTKNGKKLYNLLAKAIGLFVKGPALGFTLAIAVQTPIRDFISMSGGVFSEDMAGGLLKILNGEKGGFRTILKGIPKALKGVGPLMKQI